MAMPRPVEITDTACLRDRFFSNVEKTDNCWLWTASKNTLGYGYFSYEGRTLRAHRAAYELLVGRIPDGLVLDHLCRNPSCVNPRHLDPVTIKENTRRGLTGYHMREKAALITHCPHGHEYTPENTFLKQGKYRNCRECGRVKCRRQRARRSAMRSGVEQTHAR